VRIYLGWLSGSLKSTVHWQHRLLKDTKKNLVKVSESGKEARLMVVPKRQSFYKEQAITLAEFTLDTGRSHQIRVQAAHEGYPVLGDRKYAKLGSLFPRIALHSHYLRFHHPMNQ